ncbi:conserved hypothetical protein [Histoplasma capsulatum var. duboisii H88]|uniref:Uncharacterized protein n=2 Tax=Ajellomyces capsulatus TaxID=5037 RepID=F0UCT0_AJEC8|nr:conserved hypothetical protein [Histoplasma capsulatum H143]EGC43356.1 conserved hypothetical protein [Histoplasma capsulatum var. duboisii H88]
MYNKNFVLTMDVGQTVIAKVPNPNAGIAYFTTAIEVATVDFLILAGSATYSEHPHQSPVSQVWNNMQLVDKMKLRLDVARFQSTWLSVGFSEFGGIYYAQDQANLKPEKHLYGVTTYIDDICDDISMMRSSDDI